MLFDFLQKCSVKRDGIVSRIENQRDFVIVEINRIDQYRNERLLIFYAVGVAIPNIFARRWIAPKRQKQLKRLIEERRQRGKFVDLTYID